MKKAIITAISEVLVELNLSDIDISKIVLERPADMSHGDFATSVAMVFAPKAKKKPILLAVLILEKLKTKNLEGVKKMEVAGPGFINFYISRDNAKREVSEILSKKEEYGMNKEQDGKRIIFDYTNPNPFKVFHIGHLMPNVIGEAFTRIAEAQGALVKRYNYQGDVGRHVALTLWGLRFMSTGIPEDDASIGEKVAFFGKAYSLGATKYKELEDAAIASGKIDENKRPTSPEFAVADAEVRKINKEIYDQSVPELNKIYVKGKEWSLEHFEELYKILGTKFDRYFFESETSPVGTEIVLGNTGSKGKKIFEDSNGAVIFKGEEYKLHTRVFITRDGLPTYEGKDIGLMVKKQEAGEFDLSIIVTAEEQSEYFKVVYKASELLFPELTGKLKHIAHGMMQFATGKMSSRTGDVISGESLLMDMISKALEVMKDRDMSEEEKKVTAELVAVAAIKYSILRQSISKNTIFDPEKSLSFEGDSGPYLQYATVRSRSILAKAKKEGVENSINELVEVGLEGERLEKLLGMFPEIVLRAWNELAPHHIATYLMELSGSFNSFYASTQIVKKDDETSPYKVALTEAFSIIMKNGLNLLGIKVPDKM